VDSVWKVFPESPVLEKFSEKVRPFALNLYMPQVESARESQKKPRGRKRVKSISLQKVQKDIGIEGTTVEGFLRPQQRSSFSKQTFPSPQSPLLDLKAKNLLYSQKEEIETTEERRDRLFWWQEGQKVQFHREGIKHTLLN